MWPQVRNLISAVEIKKREHECWLHIGVTVIVSVEDMKHCEVLCVQYVPYCTFINRLRMGKAGRRRTKRGRKMSGSR